jgi:hypothetical protein
MSPRRGRNRPIRGRTGWARLRSSSCDIDNCVKRSYMGGSSPEAKPPIRGELTASPPSRPASRRASHGIRGRPAKNLAALLAASLNEKVTVTENGKCRQDFQARGSHNPAGQQIGLGRVAGHQDADRHVARRRNKGGAGIQALVFSQTKKSLTVVTPHALPDKTCCHPVGLQPTDFDPWGRPEPMLPPLRAFLAAAKPYGRTLGSVRLDHAPAGAGARLGL